MGDLNNYLYPERRLLFQLTARATGASRRAGRLGVPGSGGGRDLAVGGVGEEGRRAGRLAVEEGPTELLQH